MENIQHNLLEMLSAFLGVNLFCYEENLQIFAAEKRSECAEKIINIRQKEIIVLYQYKKEKNFEILTTKYRETYMCFSLPANRVLYIGPFLLSEFNEPLAQIDFQKKLIPLTVRKLLIAHYKGLPIFTHRYCYCLRIILEEHFFQKPGRHEAAFEIQEENPHFLTHTQVEKNYKDTIINTRKNYTIRSPIELENEWLYAISSADQKKAVEILNQINSLDTAVFSRDSVQSKKYSLAADCTLFTRVLIQKGISYTDAFAISDATIKTIDGLTTLEQLQNFEYEMVILFCETIQNYKNKIYSTPVRSIIEYIEANLSSRLTLTLLAERVFMHPAYVSTLFKKETGISVNAYILKRRIEESKILLLNTRETITDISNYYQFCNEAYYIRVFRQFAGTTPGRFRKNTGITPRAEND